MTAFDQALAGLLTALAVLLLVCLAHMIRCAAATPTTSLHAVRLSDTHTGEEQWHLSSDTELHPGDSRVVAWLGERELTRWLPERQVSGRPYSVLIACTTSDLSAPPSNTQSPECVSFGCHAALDEHKAPCERGRCRRVSVKPTDADEWYEYDEWPEQGAWIELLHPDGDRLRLQRTDSRDIAVGVRWRYVNGSAGSE